MPIGEFHWVKFSKICMLCIIFVVLFCFSGENLSVIVTFDPINVGNAPDLKFLGSDRYLERFRGKLVENLTKWDRNGDVVKEFLKLLGLGQINCF